ncbi:hypothetical protein PT277_08860 [Acetobacteraceae bacterium ESL0709]|nr:hypothetical protein [Acetobacteraceae bacterium ESL0697]MDF7678792.1 hypothetical protein [Acetobacteraceae bacterium ESL0709]
MLNRIFSKTTLIALLGATALLSMPVSPAIAHYGYHGYHGDYYHHWHHHSFGHSFARGMGWGVGMGLGYGAVNYALRDRDYDYGYRYSDYSPYYGYSGGYDGRPFVDNSQTIIYNAPPPPPVGVLPPAYPYPVPGYTTFNPGYGYTSGPITAPPNF